jgi:hypothetical protein
MCKKYLTKGAAKTAKIKIFCPSIHRFNIIVASELFILIPIKKYSINSEKGAWAGANLQK